MPKPNTRAYWRAVVWIALNDSTADGDDETLIADYITTCLVADTFGGSPQSVATDVARARRKTDATAGVS